jgi:hypothetical protein
MGFPAPFALSLSKGLPFLLSERRKGEGFDRLSPNGVSNSADGVQ